MWTNVMHHLKKFRLPLILFTGKASFLQHIYIMLTVVFRCFTHMEVHIAYIHPWPVSTKRTYINARVLLHSNASLYCRMIFNQMIHSFVKEALHILAPKLSLRNTTINWLKWLLKGFHSEVMLSSFLKLFCLFNRTLHSLVLLKITLCAF
jgi:hypothetical protein